MRVPCLLLLLPLLLLAACGDGGTITGAGRAEASLRSGFYEYSAYSDGGYLAWWGTLELAVGSGGALTGYYRLPRQCTDRFGYETDCVGYVGGRVYDDGTLRFGLDEGWLRHFGDVRSSRRAAGDWNSRILGYSDSGRWEIYAP